jgi:hypothetical protein
MSPFADFLCWLGWPLSGVWGRPPIKTTKKYWGRRVGEPSANPNSEDQATRQAVNRLFDDARRRLVETGTRNRLVHVNRGNTRGNVANIVNERSDDVYALLSSGTKMRFKALGIDKEDENTEVVLADEVPESIDEGRYTDAFLETRLAGPA